MVLPSLGTSGCYFASFNFCSNPHPFQCPIPTTFFHNVKYNHLSKLLADSSLIDVLCDISSFIFIFFTIFPRSALLEVIILKFFIKSSAPLLHFFLSFLEVSHASNSLMLPSHLTLKRLSRLSWITVNCKLRGGEEIGTLFTLVIRVGGCFRRFFPLFFSSFYFSSFLLS